MVFACIFTALIDVMLTECAIQQITRHKEDVRKLLNSLFLKKQILSLELLRERKAGVFVK